MRKQLTDAEKIAILLDALHRADRTLMEIDAVAEINSIARGIGNRKCSEWTQSVTRRARKILQAALRRVADKTNKSDKTNEKAVRLDIQAMKANGILKEAKR